MLFSSTRTRSGGIAVVLAISSSLWSVPAGATVPLPKPGTPQQVASLVAAAPGIHQLPSALVPSLSQASGDNPGTYFPATRSGCAGVTRCRYGDVGATSAIVLFGDSHAQMWLPALAPVAAASHLRLVLLWKPACPAARVTVWNPGTRSAYTACDAFRRAQVAAIKRLAPALVLLSDRTTAIYDGTGALTTDAQWQSGLEATIRALATHRTRVAVVGDTTPFSAILPECLAANPRRVQACSTKSPNPSIPTHVPAEQAAAAATGAHYLSPLPMLCTSICSAIIGRMVAYSDSQHVSATYAAFLSSDWASVLQHAALLRR